MNEKARRTVAALKYCFLYKIDCKNCPSNDECDWSSETMSLKVADLIESMSDRLEQTENKLSELLSYATGGRFSKADYSIDDMRMFVDDYNQSECNECDQLEYVNNERDGLNIMLAQAQAMLETRTKERDAAVAHLKEFDCATCVNCNLMQMSSACKKCRSADHWQWRGVEVEDGSNH